ncbi:MULTISPECIES: hypothetical protein [Olleya]|uniref:hypothetical protein n=1 Tax=Olleya TaxID=336276 RepID=UPI000C34D9B8|nr:MULTISPECIES: hypothetical protein [Olleya]PKG52054.1 hypothetical protein CXF54_05735 [Olleya sp. 1-3]
MKKLLGLTFVAVFMMSMAPEILIEEIEYSEPCVELGFEVERIMGKQMTFEQFESFRMACEAMSNL